MDDIPTPTMLSLILSLFGFFTMVTGVALFYYRKDYRRLERLEAIQRAAESREIASREARWLEKPVIWEVWADRYPKPTPKWEDFVPLNMTYDHDQLSTRRPPLRQSPLPPAPRTRGWGSVGGAPDAQQRPQPNSDVTDCNISVLVFMPTPHKQLSIEFGDEFAIGTAEVAYHHPQNSHS